MLMGFVKEGAAAVQEKDMVAGKRWRRRRTQKSKTMTCQ